MSENLEKALVEAGRYFMAVEEDPTDTELAAKLDAWLEASEEHRFAWADTLETFDMIGECPTVDEESLADPIEFPSTPQPVEPKRGLRRTVAVLAGTVAACLAFALGPNLLLDIRSDYRTETGAIENLSLEEGSSLALGAKSALDVDFSEAERRTRLLQGEAFFDVTPDPTRPFIVEMGDIEIRVLGTAFSARYDRGLSRVEVAHGHVQVTNGFDETPVDLFAGDWISIDAEDLNEQGRLEVEEVGAWQQGRILAVDRKVEDIVSELRRHFDGIIFLRSEELAAKRVSGVFKTEDPVDALTALMHSTGGSLGRPIPGVLTLSD